MIQRPPIAPITALILAALLASEARSQITVHPEDPTAILIDTLELTMELPGDVEGEGEWGTTVWLMTDGAYELVIDLESFVFPGAGAGIDTLSLAVIMKVASIRSVEEFAAAEYADSAETEAYVTVWVGAWGRKMREGAYTTLVSCAIDSWVSHKYRIWISAEGWQSLLSASVADDKIGDEECEPTLFSPQSIE